MATHMLRLTPGRLIPLTVVLAAAVARSSAQAQATAIDYGPDVVVISPQVLAAFAKGLRTEIALREAFRKELAAMKTPAQYQQCEAAAASSPERLKLAQSMMNMPADVQPDEVQRRFATIATVVEALTLKACGPDPEPFNETWRLAQLKKIERKAADAAGPVP